MACEKGRPDDSCGLTVASAVFFVVGDIVGAGVITLPYTMKQVGWWGVPLFFLSALLMCLCGTLLSKGCLLAFTSHANRHELRDPYPLLGEVSFGTWCRYTVSVVLNVSLVFTCIIFLLLLGEILTEIAPLPHHLVSYRNQLRIWFATCGLVLLPITFLGTPKDFSLVGFLATACSCLAAVVILINIAVVGNAVGYRFPTKFSSDLETIMAVFGTVQFTFGGIAIFPTIQNDMRDPERFPVAVFIGYVIVFVVYTGVSTSAFIVLSNSIQEDILTTFTRMPLFRQCAYFHGYVITAQVLICAHVMCAFVILVNPVNQQLEDIFQAPHHFCWQRIVIRTSVVVAVITIATVVPSFGPVLSLAGGSLFSLLSVIFPILFYCKLENISLAKQIALFLVITVAIVTSLGNGYVEVKNVAKVVTGTYEQS